MAISSDVLRGTLSAGVVDVEEKFPGAEQRQCENDSI
jgi:hypothetical protein